ncbi:MAG: hypothetical protein NW703_13690 [Nitrospiraceae bacterium]
MKLTRKQARDYARRWKLVDERLDRELRHTSMDVKFQMTDAAYRMAMGLGILERMKILKQETEQEIRQRWLRLKTVHL